MAWASFGNGWALSGTGGVARSSDKADGSGNECRVMAASSRRDRTGAASALPPAPTLFPVDHNPFHLLLRSRRFRQRHGQHAVLEGRGDLVLLDFINRNATFKPTVIPLAE